MGAVWDTHINSVLTSVQDNDVVSLALLLLHHAVSKEASYFWPFINSLPREYKGLYKMLTKVQLLDAAESVEASLTIPVALAPPTSSSEGVRFVKVLGEATLSALIASSV
jgi:hypothetical protein